MDRKDECIAMSVDSTSPPPTRIQGTPVSNATSRASPKWPEPAAMPDDQVASTWLGEVMHLSRRPTDDVAATAEFEKKFPWLTGMQCTQLDEKTMRLKHGQVKLGRPFFALPIKVFGVRCSRDRKYFDAFFLIESPKNPRYVAIHSDACVSEMLQTKTWVDLTVNFTMRQSVGYDQLLREQKAHEMVAKKIKLPDQDSNYITKFRNEWKDCKPFVRRVQWIPQDLDETRNAVKQCQARAALAQELTRRYVCTEDPNHSRALLQDVTWVTWFKVPFYLAGQLTLQKQSTTVWFFLDGRTFGDDSNTGTLWLASSIIYLSVFAFDDFHRYTIVEGALAVMQEEAKKQQKLQQQQQPRRAKSSKRKDMEEEEKPVVPNNEGADRKAGSSSAPSTRDTDMNQADSKERAQQLAYGIVQTTEMEREQLANLADVLGLNMEVMFPSKPMEVLPKEQYQAMLDNIQQMRKFLETVPDTEQSEDDARHLAELDVLEARLQKLQLEAAQQTSMQDVNESTTSLPPLPSSSSSSSSSATTTQVPKDDGGVVSMSD